MAESLGRGVEQDIEKETHRDKQDDRKEVSQRNIHHFYHLCRGLLQLTSLQDINIVLTAVVTRLLSQFDMLQYSMTATVNLCYDHSLST